MWGARTCSPRTPCGVRVRVCAPVPPPGGVRERVLLRHFPALPTLAPCSARSASSCLASRADRGGSSLTWHLRRSTNPNEAGKGSAQRPTSGSAPPPARTQAQPANGAPRRQQTGTPVDGEVARVSEAAFFLRSAFGVYLRLGTVAGPGL